MKIWFFGLGLAVLLLAAGPAESGEPGLLRVAGTKVVDSAGQDVTLRGVNVEFQHFRDFLGEEDIARIAALGANAIRLVLAYHDFEPRPFSYDDESFARLDQIVAWCRRHRVWLILDMHLAPGIQNGHDFVVHRQDQPRFWAEPENQRRFYALWEVIARRYAGESIIAAYDLLNEGTPETIAQYHKVMTRAAAAIRAVDPKRILVVEEAIMPGWHKELVLIDDPNVIYSIHFFHPPQFTFYSTTSLRPVTTYPGEMLKDGQRLAAQRRLINQEQEAGAWNLLELSDRAPTEAELLVVSLFSAAGGKVWFDDLELWIDDDRIDLPAPLVANNSFAIDYPGFNWTLQGTCGSKSKDRARSGQRALLFRDCSEPAWARSSPMAVEPGRLYRLRGWYQISGLAGEAGMALNWHRTRIFDRIDREILAKGLAYALEFRQLHDVPIYVGEFTMHTNPWPDSARRYLHDLLTLMKEADLHWTFWEYYSTYPGVGLFRDHPPQIGNPVALEALEQFWTE